MSDLRDAATAIRDSLADECFTRDTGRRCADAIEAAADALDALEKRVEELEGVLGLVLTLAEAGGRS